MTIPTSLPDAAAAPTPGAARPRLILNLYQFVTLLLCALTFIVEGFDMQTMALAVPTVAPEWGHSPAQFGLAISALNIGAVISTALIAPLGDTYGRRRLICGALLIMGACVAATATATETWQLAGWRFVSGLAFGCAVVNVHALIAEQFPQHRRALFLTIATVNLSLGGIVGGFANEWITLSFGWRGLFVIGGVGAMIMGTLLMLWIRDSRRLTPPLARGADGKPVVKPSVWQLLSPEFRGITIPLWLMKLLNTMIVFVLLSWLPTMLTSIGWSLGESSRGSATMQIGGLIGGLALAWLIDRGQIRNALLATFFGMVVVFALFSLTPQTMFIWSILLAIGGGLTNGTHHALNALAATLYPSEIRATGAGWANAMSRTGSISGSLIGALLIHNELSVAHTVTLLAVPAFFAILLTFVLDRAQRARADALSRENQQ
jgi:AAHS family 4-hydroxybenzoate transporter-like MFS transporter